MEPDHGPGQIFKMHVRQQKQRGKKGPNEKGNMQPG